MDMSLSVFARIPRLTISLARAAILSTKKWFLKMQLGNLMGQVLPFSHFVKELATIKQVPQVSVLLLHTIGYELRRPQLAAEICKSRYYLF